MSYNIPDIYNFAHARANKLLTTLDATYTIDALPSSYYNNSGLDLNTIITDCWVVVQPETFLDKIVVDAAYVSSYHISNYKYKIAVDIGRVLRDLSYRLICDLSLERDLHVWLDTYTKKVYNDSFSVRTDSNVFWNAMLSILDFSYNATQHEGDNSKKYRFDLREGRIPQICCLLTALKTKMVTQHAWEYTSTKRRRRRRRS
jgi:hypothetical protein